MVLPKPPKTRETRFSEISKEERKFWLQQRQALIMQLGAIEDYLGLERSIVPRRKRDARRGGENVMIGNAEGKGKMVK